MPPESDPIVPGNNPAMAVLDRWLEQGWLRALDRALARFLLEQDAKAEPVVLLAAALASHQLGRGHICLDLTALTSDPVATLALPPEDAERVEAPSAEQLASEWRTLPPLAQWQQQLQQSSLVDSDGRGSAPLVLSGERLYLRRTWQYEHSVACSLRDRLQCPLASPADLNHRLDELFGAAGNAINWQRAACALATRSAFTLITGGPGTGKTTTVVKLLALLQGAAVDAGQRLRIRLAAPTGKAAARLTESIRGALENLDLPDTLRPQIPSEVTTLHRLLGSRPDSRRFRHNRDNPLHADVVVVDEASMVDLEMMAALLEALEPETRLVLLGDKDQLASVEAGAVLGDLCAHAEAGRYTADTVAWLQQQGGVDVSGYQVEAGSEATALDQQVAMLRVSHRFDANSGIGQLATAVNAGDVQTASSVLASAQYGDIALLKGDDRLETLAVNGNAQAFDPVAAGEPAQGYRYYLTVLHQRRPAPEAPLAGQEDWARQVLRAYGRFQMLCALRRGPWGVDGLNQRVEQALAVAGLLRPEGTWYEGRPVLVTRNNYALGLMNGDVGITLALPQNGGGTALRVAFLAPDNSIRLILPSRLTDAETVFAMTVHKSQGSEFEHAALVLPDRTSAILNRELIYTGITRARRWLSLVAVDTGVFETAVAQRTRRASGLRQQMTV